VIRIVLASLLVMLTPVIAFAHAVGLQAKLVDGTVKVEGYFDDDTPTADAKVTVTAESGAVVAEGKTDGRGIWSFPCPAAGKYRIKLDAGDGHSASTTLVIAVTTPTEPEVVSSGPQRKEFTRFPWEQIGLGLAIIGFGTLLFWWRKRSRAESLHRS
jgi:hypothetical protein